MKKIITILCLCLLVSGCEWDYNFNDEYLYTTMYPIEYATKELYSDHAKIESVYPMGSDNTYEVTQKKKDEYAKGTTFIYSGLANEAYLARDLLNKNGNLQLIDATKSMTSEGDISSIWLDPSNYLMLCSNIKSSLIDYNDNAYVKEDIEEHYKELNEKVSELDVQLYNIGKNGNYNTLLTTNDVFNYLTKYNINIISLDSDNQQIDKAYSDANKMISNKSIQYLFYLEGDEFTERQQKLITDYSLIAIEINNLFTLNDDEKNANEDYVTIMNNIISEYKKELYKK
ncbi:MAG: metal ABC transporter substrate-binding protein [bacterium]|nr:metal ABC transporter substrate-binding protein [bacterium]